MATLYARQTALPSLLGRIDYISNPKRQEHLLAVHDGSAELLEGAYWRQLASEAQEAFDRFGQKTRLVKDKRTGEEKEQELKAVQGREIHGKLPNSLLERMEPAEIAGILAEDFQSRYGRPAMVAIHYNKQQTNLHFHLIYGERELLQEPVIKVAERNLFFDENGKRRYKKSEILDSDGKLREGCRIVKKGEIYEKRAFGSADHQFSYSGWMKDAKTNWLLPLLNGKLAGDVEYEEFDPNSGKLAQQHVGKSREREQEIEEYNRLVRLYNDWIDEGYINHEEARKLSTKIRREPERNSLLLRFLQAVIDALREAEIPKAQEKKPRAVDDIIAGAERKRRYLAPNTMDLRPDLELQSQLDRACGRDFVSEIRQERREYWRQRNKEIGR